MKITFFLNQMGVYSTKWYEENNIPYKEFTRFNRILGKDVTLREWDTHYALGRIDIHGVHEEPYGLEYGVGVMEQESWIVLGNYLSRLTLDYLPTKDELFLMFEEDTKHKIRWFI